MRYDGSFQRQFGMFQLNKKQKCGFEVAVLTVFSVYNVKTDVVSQVIDAPQRIQTTKLLADGQSCDAGGKPLLEWGNVYAAWGSLRTQSSFQVGGAWLPLLTTALSPFVISPSSRNL